MGDIRDGWHIVVGRVRSVLTRRRRRIMFGISAFVAGLVAAGTYLLTRSLFADADAVVESVYFCLIMVATFSGMTALICMGLFVRVRPLGRGPAGVVTPESARELRLARSERRPPDVTPPQREFLIAQAEHTRDALTPSVVLQLAGVPFVVGLLLLLPVVGSSWFSWLMLAAFAINLTPGLFLLALLGRTTQFLPNVKIT